MFRPPRSRGALISPFLGQQVGVRRPPCIQGTLSKPLFWVINGGAEGPGRRLQREGPAEAVPTRTAARPRRDAGHGLRGAEGRRGPAGASATAPRAGQVGRRGAQRPAAGRPHRLQPEHAGKDEVRPGGDGRLHPGGRREPLQNKNAETVGRATKRAARELTGDDGNFVVTTDLGNKFATLEGAACAAEAVHRTKRPEDRNAIAVVDRGIQTLKKDLATRVARKGGQWSDHFERAAGAYNARPHKTVHGAPEDVPATEFRVLQDNEHNKDLTDRRVKAVEDAFRAPTNAARSFNPQYGDVQRLGAVDSMTVRRCRRRRAAATRRAG